jgi:hypothetical protein
LLNLKLLISSYFNVHFIPHTNLILVVTDGKCQCIINSTNIRAKEVDYSFEGRHHHHQRQTNNHQRQDDGGGNEDDNPDSVDDSAQSCRTPKLNLYRKRPAACMHYNANVSISQPSLLVIITRRNLNVSLFDPQENEIKEDCGGGSSLRTPGVALLLLLSCLLTTLTTSGVLVVSRTI